MRYYRQKIHTAKTPSIPFLPVVLKDYTFFNENSTFLVSDPHLINFAKFRSISQFIDKIRAMMNVPYWFASELTHFPFFPQVKNETMGRSLDGIAEWIEERLNTIQDCYLDCNLL
ncbi:uncharacterized protein BX663DRAFT_432437 [Cokeromyces recurvatus]|uniref:uncharacterized protein n=1 Tax=Cokeromyces recurvatus TaxID=90255 RepID=UPI00221EF1E8|nr:uncharacterized protein BX663DRAFT_432437 [Cokeromyces recurvatus]KAI7903873.1 hypothetical protein BX663DRAFT_432437 [Cokeromyces recurvatus]